MKFSLAPVAISLVLATVVCAQPPYPSSSRALQPSGVPGHSSLTLSGFPSPTETEAPGTVTAPTGTPAPGTTHPATTAPVGTAATTTRPAGTGTAGALSSAASTTGTPTSSSSGAAPAGRWPIHELVVAVVALGAAFAVYL